MKKDYAIVVSIACLTFLFNFIFWGEKMGLNVLLFAIAMVIALFWNYRPQFENRVAQLATTGFLLSAVAVVWSNSLFSKFMFMFSLPILVGAVQANLKFFGGSFLLYFLNCLESPIHLTQTLKSPNILGGGVFGKFFKLMKAFVIPIMVVPIFYFIYYIANPKFAVIGDAFFGKLFKWLTFDWSITRLLFFAFGFIIVAACVFKHKLFDFSKSELAKTNELTTPEHTEDRDDYFRNALLLLVLLNIMLGVNNVLDVPTVWGYQNVVQNPAELKMYVHQGTYLLIVAILLAIGVIAVLFKKDLNFHTKTPTLQLLAFVWIGQNIFSAISVGSRNWQYIYNCGLAYKRVGVFLFLMITIVGLIFLFLKVKNKKTFFFVTKRTLWAAYAILLAASFVNWDVLITRFNLTNPVKIGNLDTYFLTRIVSEKNIPVLLEYKDVLIKAGEAKIKMDSMANRETSDADYDRNQTDITVDINNKCRRFVEEQKQYSFLSWNVADYTVKNTLSQKVVF